MPALLKLLLAYILAAQLGLLLLVAYLGVVRREALPEGAWVGLLLLAFLFGLLGVVLALAWGWA
ncbi:hypothetical protein [Thermus sp.]|uniref:hypothetical protein n=1 Tax=Thermus sp. TaxID=275 RepID=UPI002636DB4F|nr:hypothetical protein [Thermus sp.]MCX7851048.1 hypothetical protein [Thermus sp.]